LFIYDSLFSRPSLYEVDKLGALLSRKLGSSSKDNINASPIYSWQNFRIFAASA
jgi:hypothetical protein